MQPEKNDTPKEIVIQQNELCVLNDELTLQSMQTQEFRQSYLNLIKATKELATLKKSVDKKIGELMLPEYLDTGNNKIEMEEFNITYVAGFVRQSINTAALKEEQPDIYEKYTKLTVTADSIRCNINKKKEEGDK